MDTNSTETLIAQWEEPPLHAMPLSKSMQFLMYAGGGVLAVAFVALAYWGKQFSFYLAAVGSLVGAAALANQNKREEVVQEVVITNERLLVGASSYPLAELSGFWLEHDSNRLMINVEKKKRTLLPISFAFRSESHEDAQAVLTQVLPELEAPQSPFANSINKYFRF